VPLIPRLTSLWRNLFHKDRVDQEFSEEIQAYLDLLTEAKLKQGLSPQEARRNALLEVGGIEQVEEKVREVRMGQFLETAWRDVRLGVRTLVHSPIFTVVTVLSLALGVGANTAVFSVVNGLLLQPLPYPESEQIVHVWHTPPQQSFPGLDRFSVSPANYIDWKAQSTAFEQMAVYTDTRFSLSTSNDPLPLIGAVVSSDFFSVLRSNAMLGRTFTPDEERPGREQVVVIGHGLWQRAFGASPNTIGQTLTLNSRSFTVVGIMPAGFEFPREAELWVPLAWEDNERQVRSDHNYLVVARLKQNVSLEQAKAEMSTISSRLEQQYPEENSGWGTVVIPLRDDLVGDIRRALLVLFCAVGFVLLIACANVANLILARGANRQKEIAVRVALGAGRARLVRQLLTESVLLAVTGGLLGLLLALWGSNMLVQLGDLPNAGDIGIDTWALGFTLLVSFGAGIIIGIVPALQFTRTSISETLKQGSGRSGGASLKQHTRKALVISEVALSLVLLIGAGLMIRSFWKLQNVNPGFDSSNALTMSVVLNWIRYPEAHQRIAFVDRAMEQIRAVPGVVSVGTTTKIPLTGGGSTQPFTREGGPVASIAEQPMALTRYISPDYFRAIGIPLQQGRFFSDYDRDNSVPVVIISEAMARRFWPGENPIGQRLTPTFHVEQGPREIVGVVGDV
jgi:putative ABC transport system permease protein